MMVNVVKFPPLCIPHKASITLTFLMCLEFIWFQNNPLLCNGIYPGCLFFVDRFVSEVVISIKLILWRFYEF